MNQTVQRALTCLSVLAATLTTVGATGGPSQAGPADDHVSARLRAIVDSDPTASIDGTGRLFYREPAPERRRAPEPSAPHPPPFPLDQTFALHSNPGSPRTILLDFDGMSVSGSIWNRQDGLSPGSHPAWSIDGDRTTFNTTERTGIQEVWQQVSEDYAAFDVDVTTEDPGLAGIIRSSAADQVYGTRALISPSSAALQQLCGGGCGGVAYLDVFDDFTGDIYQPAWIFPQTLFDDPKSIGEAVTHEVGHNLNLSHDGNSEQGYDEGHPLWAPIMGIGYYEPVTQWSKGDYAGANNHQDDLAFIANAGLSVRTDEAGGAVAQAADALPAGPAYISSRSDKDFYEIGQCSGSVQVAALPAARSPDLDIELRLYRADGTEVTSADPLSTRMDELVASGMSATIDTSVDAGSYVVAVDGVGRGTPLQFYDDYGSIGAYTLAVSGCAGGPVDPVDPVGSVPDAPTDLIVESGPAGTTATIAWTAPAGAVTGYLVTLGGVTDPVGGDTTSFTVTGLSRGKTYAVEVAAVNDAGTGPGVATTVTTYNVPGMPAGVSAGSGSSGGKITARVRWRAPAAGGSSITGYRVKATRWSTRGSVLWTGTAVLSSTARSVVLWLPKAGLWSFRVQALNGVGYGALSSASNRVRGR